MLTKHGRPVASITPYAVRSERRTTEQVMAGYVLAAARDQRRRAGVFDAVIAATALAHDLTVWTQDDDFDVLAELAPDLGVHRG